MRERLEVDALEAGVLARDTAIVARAITLAESSRPDDVERFTELLHRLMPHTGDAVRVGITGVPGVGKSTFIEGLGKQLTATDKTVAVLAIDPSSARGGGSILGDKTRMQELARDPKAFVRPSPASGSLGGVTRRTREAITVCEAAGFDVVLVETVGVGQSETMVADMVDFFLVLMLAGAGDELQGIKRGVLELADLVAVNKADGDNVAKARLARAEYARALHLIAPKNPDWVVPVVTCSGLEGTGVAELWTTVEKHHAQSKASGRLAETRASQRVRWMWRTLEERLMDRFRGDPAVTKEITGIEDRVRAGAISPDEGARTLLALFRE